MLTAAKDETRDALLVVASSLRHDARGAAPPDRGATAEGVRTLADG